MIPDSYPDVHLNMKIPEIPKPAKGLKRVWKAFFYSISGFKLAFRDEAAFRQELILVVILSPICLILPVETWLKAAILMSHGFILITELLNTAVESIVDKVSPEYSDVAKKAKDSGSAAVLISLLTSVGLWGYACTLLIS